MEGEINAEEVFILNGSTVQGDVIQTLLEIAPGASFEGAIRRRAPAAPTAMLAPPPVEAEPAAEAEPLLLATEPVEAEAEVAVAETLSSATADEPPAPANSGDDVETKKAG